LGLTPTANPGARRRGLPGPNKQEEVIQMAGQKNDAPKMGIKGIQSYGSATQKPAETSKTLYGDDLRSGGGKSK